MKELPLRRSQLVTTFGPGALVVSPEGETAVVGALDGWFHDRNGYRVTAIGEYEIQEPRLKSLLQVKHLLTPPDFRPSYQYKFGTDGVVQTNTDIYIPLLRFPAWHYCPNCKTLHQLPLSSRTNWFDCRECKQLRKMIQVPFVIVCNHGHIADFPWPEWVHGNEETTCENDMRLISTGGATLDSLKVVCKCGSERSLRGIMVKNSSDTDENGASVLAKTLNKEKDDGYFYCPGTKPWYGSEQDKDKCASFPIAVLKNSVNVYFPNTISAIHLPGERNTEVEELIDMFERFGVTSTWLDTYDSIEGKLKFVRQTCPPEINLYRPEDIELAILYVIGAKGAEEMTEINEAHWVENELRKKEFDMLITEVSTKNLKVAKEWDSANGDSSMLYMDKFGTINRVTKLKETIVLTGFSRLTSDRDEMTVSEIQKGRSLLFREPHTADNNWLPAFKVYGEGIFFTLNRDRVIEWENSDKVRNYFSRCLKRYDLYGNHSDGKLISPRFLLIHTLAHVIIDELELTCGYNSASLRERLYLQDETAVLIYTSSGDNDGTFGGLVRMGKTKNFFMVVAAAIERARWCSSDPVCTEIGMSSGQGVNLMNGAACHSCAYLPETSCERRNLYLDRTLLIHDKIGYFST